MSIRSALTAALGRVAGVLRRNPRKDLVPSNDPGFRLSVRQIVDGDHVTYEVYTHRDYAYVDDQALTLKPEEDK